MRGLFAWAGSIRRQSGGEGSARKLCVTYGNEAALRLYESFGFYPFTIDCLQKRS
ncbi:MAG: hypothetical protein V8Q30_02760 [Acutalibacteraceae bacterium]